MTRFVVEEKRPVELENLFMVGDRTFEREHLFPTLIDGRPNPEGARLEEQSRKLGGRSAGKGRGRRSLYTPSRLDVVERLNEEGLLPAIFFIFSRNGCNEAAESCFKQGLRLTSPDERRRITQIIESRLEIWKMMI